MASVWRNVALAALVLAGSTTRVHAAEAPGGLPFALKAVGPGVYAAIDGPGGVSGSNAGFVIGDDGVLVVDSFFNPDATKALVAEIHRLTPKPIRYVVNTHYHVDHVGGDAVLKAEGAVIIAHRNVRGWVRTENIHLFGDRITPARRAQVEALVFPDITTDKDLTVWLGGRKVLVRTVLGHTGGDLVIAVPDAKVLFCGDILWRRTSPNVIDGTVAQWIATVDGFRHASDAGQTTFIPGHGDVATVSDVLDFEGYLTDLSDLVKRERSAGLSGDALVATALPIFTKQHGDWAAFSHFAPLELRFMDEELAGTKRTPQPRPD